MGDVSPDAGNPQFDIEVIVELDGTVDGIPTRVRISFHQGNLGMQDFAYSPWIPISAYPAIRSAAGQSQAAFNAAVNGVAWGNFYTHWYTTAAARKVLRGAIFQTPVPQPTSALNLPP